MVIDESYYHVAVVVGLVEMMMMMTCLLTLVAVDSA